MVLKYLLIRNNESEVLINANKDSEILIDNLVSVKTGKYLFEKPHTNKCVPPLVERLTAVLETPEIMIIERNDNSQVAENENTAEVVNEEDSTLEMKKTKRNAKISPEELPPPQTQHALTMYGRIRRARYYVSIDTTQITRRNPLKE
ncbi:hypothetical protein Anas_00126 [Armadillidium nasatum]|uniref:Uncharacterized protein n=1 Tax=Armadillidium nasatum TaxID=96803 RepID=A0A5N5TLI9_9CRUS|nr:hypothetical protein Anas_00126 [Armadillidium nasatum]